MYGVVKGVLYCNNERVDQLNNRIYDRNLPSSQLQMTFDPRPVKTRQVLFPVADCHMPSNTPITVQPTFNTNQQFNPGSSAPFSGYATKVDDESRLQDIFMARQKWTAQTEYVPSSKSDLYVAPHLVSSRPVHQTHPMLFEQQNFAPFNPNLCGIGDHLMYNHTRQQVKNMN